MLKICKYQIKISSNKLRSKHIHLLLYKKYTLSLVKNDNRNFLKYELLEYT